MTSASAPGKIILFGEHAVVYGRPALAIPVMQVHTDVTVTEKAIPIEQIHTVRNIKNLNQSAIWIDAPDIGASAPLEIFAEYNDPISFTLYKTLDALGIHGPPEKSLNVHIKSDIPVASGLGSGAAVSVAIIRAMSAHFKRPLTDEQVNEIAYETEKIHHGTPSGIDNTVITYGKPVFFVKGQPIETFKVGKPFTIVIGDTGISAPTKESVGDVRKLWEADKEKWERVFDQIGEIARKAKEKIENGEWESLGEMMNANHALLQEMTVSSPKLDRLVNAARKAGALGAKLSGGGRGGNMIALVKPEIAESVAKSLKEAAAKNTITTTINS